MLQNYQFKNSL